MLQHQNALSYAVADISQQFNRCHFSYESSLLNITLALKSKRGLPTYCLEDCKDTTLYPLRHKVCGFGGKQTPQVASYCQQNSVRVYKLNHPDISNSEIFLSNVVETILKKDAWMDDLFVYIGIFLLYQWLDLCELPRPKWSDTFNEEQKQAYILELEGLADELMVVICRQMTKILQYAGFKIKLIKTKNPMQQKQLDILVNEQKIGNDDENFIEVRKPTQRDLHNQLKSLSPKMEFPDFIEENIQSGVPHLGLSYEDGKIKLLKKSLCFVYSANGKKTKSPEFLCFQDFSLWNNKVEPQYTRRSLFSLVAQTQDATGRHLALFRARMKLLIRGFLKKKPAAGWEYCIDDEDRKQLLFNIEIYFCLVQKVVVEPKIAKYSSKRSILAFSDASDSLYSISISVIYTYVVQGIVRNEASHLCLIPYSAHLQMINILLIEMVGFSKLLTELAGYILELKSLNIYIPEEAIYLGTDSMVLIKMLRSKVNYLQKSSSHKIAKILIQMNTLGLNSFDNLFWVNQKLANFYPDYITKKGKVESCQTVLNIYEKLFDFNWLKEGKLPDIPGLQNVLPKPKNAELEELRQGHVLAAEWDNFCREPVQLSLIHI